MALKNPAFGLVDVRSAKTRIGTVVRKFPYSDRLFESNELVTILTCFDKKTSTILFKYSVKKKKSNRQRTQNTEAI